jgi:LysM repeat protein
MRQAKRFFYLVVLNIAISAITIIVVLQIWQNSHPPLSAQDTPAVIIVTPTQSEVTPALGTQSSTMFGSTLEPGVLATDATQSSAEIKMLYYQVKEGDTMGALAVEFNISVADILAANGLTDPDSISVGQILRIPTSPLPTYTLTPVPPTPTLSPTLPPAFTPTAGPTDTPSPTLSGLEAQLDIDQVIGMGVLDNEHVVLSRTGDGPLSLAGWRLEDNQGHVYIFPQLTLYPGGTVNLNSRSGQDTVVDLFWGLTTAIWKSGKLVSLYDSNRELRSSYTIP